MSSTWTSRTWRTTVAGAGLQQLEDGRQRADRDAAAAALAHDRARSVPGADGIAIVDLVGLGLVEDPRRAPSVRAEHADALDADARA